MDDFQQRLKELKEKKQLIASVCETEAGLEVFRTLMNISGYKQLSVALDLEGRVMMESTIFNEGMRQVYLIFRNYIPAHCLNEIEKEVSNAD